MILLVTGLESLFNTSKEQVGYTLRQRCSYFLIRDIKKRYEFSQIIKDIYNLRSQFVHGQGVSKAILDNEELQVKLIVQAELVLRASFNKDTG